MFGKRDTEVVVVGAGPVGLLTALTLAERGVKVEIVDEERRTAAHSYALVLHPETLRILFRPDLFRNVFGEGNPLKRIAWYEGADRKAELAFPQPQGSLPFAMILPQSTLESALEQALERWDVEVKWNHRLIGLEPHDEGVVAEIAKLDRAPSGYPFARMEWIVSKTFKWNASYAVGADGYNSFVRRRLDLDFQAHGESQSFSVYEFGCDAAMLDEVRICLNPGSTDVLWPISANRFRWNFEIEDSARHDPTPERLQDLIRERAPWFDGKIDDIRWSTSVTFERRLVERFGTGRVWLAGDAAHITSPVGAQSMNIGLREATELALALGEVLREGASPGVLERYSEQRVAEWRKLLFLDGEPTAAASAERWVAERAARIVPCLPAAGHDLAKLTEMMGIEFSAMAPENP